MLLLAILLLFSYTPRVHSEKPSGTILSAKDACIEASAHCGTIYKSKIFPGDEYNLAENVALPKCIKLCTETSDCRGINYRKIDERTYCTCIKDSVSTAKLGIDSLINETNSVYIDGISSRDRIERSIFNVRISKGQAKELWCRPGEKWLSCADLGCKPGATKIGFERMCAGKRERRDDLDCVCEKGLYRREKDWACVPRKMCKRRANEDCPDPNDIFLETDECVFEDVCNGKSELQCGAFKSCVCKRGYFRNQEGQCVPMDKCESDSEEKPDEETCGMPPIDPVTGNRLRIIGGQDAIPYSWPWQVWFKRGCGGTIIAEDIILTAGHCVSKNEPNLKAIVGSYLSRNQNEPGEEAIKVESLIRHPEFDNEYLYNDVAVLKLKTPIKFDETKHPACWPSSDLPMGAKLWVTGWGTLDSWFISLPNELQQVSVNLVPFDVCKVYYGSDILDHTVLCASSPGKDACQVENSYDFEQGDSGGPLVYENNGSWELHGIVSWGEGCAERYHPGVYTKVTHYKDWIEQSIQKLRAASAKT